MSFEIYTIGNADLYREVFNAVAALCGSSMFKLLLLMTGSLGILWALFNQGERGHEKSILHWFYAYLFVCIFIFMSTTVVIVNTADETDTPKVVDGVPYGLALPAYFITAVMHGLASEMDTVFALPDNMQYQRTGMLFGSRLFNLSVNAKIEDPDFKGQMDTFMKSCVIGDIMINKKYTFNDVLHSEDIWGLITSKPSPIRGMYINGSFETCKDSVTYLEDKLNRYAEVDAANNLATKLATKQAYTDTAVREALSSTYSFFGSEKTEALSIIKQNLMMNAYRSGMKNYAKEVGSPAGMQNLARTMAMLKTRESWATSSYLGEQSITTIQSVMLLLMFCLFPIISALVFLPGKGFAIYKNFVECILWLEAFPLMYAAINMIQSFYMKSKFMGAVTLSNVNLLAQQQSDIAGVAGTLIDDIPVLIFVIVQGYRALSHVAGRVGRQNASIAQGTSAAVATGNLSYGNVSTDNATANNRNFNKHDTNFTDMHGGYTEQMANGSSVTSNLTPHKVFNTAGAMSHMATGVNFASSISSGYSQDLSNSISTGSSYLTQYSDIKAHNDSLGVSASHGENTSLSEDMGRIISMRDNLAESEGISQSDALSRLSQASLGLSGSLGVGAGTGGVGINGKVGLNAGTSGQLSSKHDDHYSVGYNRGVSESDAKDFKEAASRIESYARNNQVSDSNSDTQNLVIQTGNELKTAEAISNKMHLAESNSEAINTVASQLFANQYQDSHPLEAESVLTATGNESLIESQSEAAREWSLSHKEEIMSRARKAYENPQHGFISEQQREKFSMSNYKGRASGLEHKGSGLGVGHSQIENEMSAVSNKLSHAKSYLDKSRQEQSRNTASLKEHGGKKIDGGEDKAKRSVKRQILSDLVEHIGK